MSHRCGTVAMVGRPNTGKSSLLNRLVGEKLSIVSARPQTTRHLVTGILTRPACQYIFIDDRGQIAGASESALQATPAAKLGLTAHEKTGFHHRGGHVIAVKDLPTIGWTAIFRQRASICISKFSATGKAAVRAKSAWDAAKC